MITARYLTFAFSEVVDVSEIRVSTFVNSEARVAYLRNSDKASELTVDGDWSTVATGKVFKVQLTQSDSYSIAEVVAVALLSMEAAQVVESAVIGDAAVAELELTGRTLASIGQCAPTEQDVLVYSGIARERHPCVSTSPLFWGRQ